MVGTTVVRRNTPTPAVINFVTNVVIHPLRASHKCDPSGRIDYCEYLKDKEELQGLKIDKEIGEFVEIPSFQRGIEWGGKDHDDNYHINVQ